MRKGSKKSKILITNYAIFHEIKTKYVKKVSLSNAEVNKKLKLLKLNSRMHEKGK